MSIRHNFPGLFYVEFESGGEMKIVDSVEYYPAILTSEKSFEKAAKEVGITEEEVIDNLKEALI